MHSNTPATALTAPIAGWMPGRGPWLWSACAVFTLAILLLNPNYHWAENRQTPFAADFVQEWVAGDMLLSGAASKIYDRAAFQTWQHDAVRLGFTWPETQYYPAVYPPPYYCLTAPLACLPYRVAGVVWLCGLVAAYGCAAQLSMRAMRPQPALAQSTLHSTVHATARSMHTSHSSSGSEALRLQLFWCLGLLMPAMFFGCVLGQKGSIWLLILCGCVALLKRQRPVLAGCVAALLTLKPTMCILLPAYLLVMGQWRAAVGFAVSTAAIYGAAALVVPWSLWTDYLHVILGASEYQLHAGYRPGWSSSLTTLLSYLAMPKSFSLAIVMLCAVGWLIQLRLKASRLHAPLVATSPEALWQLVVATSLLSPHAYFYDLTWLLLPLSGWIVSAPRRGLRNLTVVWVGMFLGQTFEFGPAIPAIALLSTCLLSARD